MRIETISLFLNGTACFWDETGKQIPELNRRGWCGLHEAKDVLSEDAAVLIVDWRAGKALELNRTQVDKLLEVIRKRRRRCR